MKNFQKILLTNLGIILIYTLLLKGLSLFDNSGTYSIGMMFMVAGHTGINILAALIMLASTENRSKSGSFLLCAGIVLVIGFSACLGGSTF